MRTGLSSSSVPRKPSLQWILELGPMVASPVFDNNTIYSATITGRIYALQKYQRQIKWHSNIGSPIVSSPLLQKDLLIAATFDSWVKDTKGFLGKNLVFALNAKTGEEVWVFDIDGDVFSSPCVAQEMIIIGSMNKILFAIDINNGNPKWTFETQGEIWSSPSFNGDQIFVGCDDGFLVLLKSRWQFTMENKIEW